MELTRTLVRLAATRPHVLLAVAPGATAVRLAVERALRERGWAEAASPADANLLIVCGDPSGQLTDMAGQTWRQMPEPKRHIVVFDPTDADALLDAAAAQLTDRASQRLELVPQHVVGAGHMRSGGPTHTAQEHGATHEQRDHFVGISADDGGGEIDETGAHDSAGEHGAHRADAHVEDGANEHPAGQHDEHGASDDQERGSAGEHAGHGAGAVVAGLPLASRGSDRDGLKLDRLHLPLGPVLADWPAGLVVRAAVQGDVLQEAEAFMVGEGLRAGKLPFWNEPWLRADAGEPVAESEAARRLAGAHLDSLGRLLAVAGWGDAAEAARRLRDDVLAGAGANEAERRFSRLDRRLRRSRLLRWQLVGLGVLDRDRALASGVGGPALRAGGDVWARLLRWLDEAGGALVVLDSLVALEPPFEGPRGGLGGEPPSQALLDALPSLLVGCELAAVRLIVASLDPDSDELVGRPVPVAVHG